MIVLIIFALFIIFGPRFLNALDVSEGAEVDVHCEAFAACRMHGHATEAEEVAQTAPLRLHRVEVPGQDAIVGLVEDLSDAGPVLTRHHLVIAVYVGDALTIIVSVSLFRLGRVADSEVDKVDPVLRIVRVQLWTTP